MGGFEQPAVLDYRIRPVNRKGNDDVIDLTQPQADITMADGAWVAYANGGKRRLSGKAVLLDLSGDVTVFHDTACRFQTDAATIDLKAHTAKGDQPVEDQRPTVKSPRMGLRYWMKARR